MPKLSNTLPPRAVYLYDCSLPVEARKDHRLEFPTGMAAARYLAVNNYRIYTHARLKTRLYSKSHDKWFAARYKN